MPANYFIHNTTNTQVAHGHRVCPFPSHIDSLPTSRTSRTHDWMNLHTDCKQMLCFDCEGQYVSLRYPRSLSILSDDASEKAGSKRLGDHTSGMSFLLQRLMGIYDRKTFLRIIQIDRVHYSGTLIIYCTFFACTISIRTTPQRRH